MAKMTPSLTSAQRQTLRTAILADPVAGPLGTANDEAGDILRN